MSESEKRYTIIPTSTHIEACAVHEDIDPSRQAVFIGPDAEARAHRYIEVLRWHEYFEADAARVAKQCADDLRAVQAMQASPPEPESWWDKPPLL